MPAKLEDLKAGDRLQYMPFGSTAPRTCIVETVEEDVKNGEPGFSGRTPEQLATKDDFGVWGYLSQVIAINGRWT